MPGYYHITSYLCRQYSYNKQGLTAVIYLYDASNTIRGVARFYPDGTHIPEASEDTSIGRIYIYLPISRFTSFVDILRNEKPIYLRYASPTNAFLQTLLEPTGEGEEEA